MIKDPDFGYRIWISWTLSIMLIITLFINGKGGLCDMANVCALPSAFYSWKCDDLVQPLLVNRFGVCYYIKEEFIVCGVTNMYL